MLTYLYWSIICFEVCTVVLYAILQVIRQKSAMRNHQQKSLLQDISGIPLVWVKEGKKVYREVKFYLIRFPVQLQSTMTNNFQRFSSRSVVSEVFPKHLGYNNSCTPWMSAVPKFPAYQYSHFPMQSWQTGFDLPVKFTYFSYRARSELEESLNLCGMKLPLEFHKEDEYIWTKIQWE